MTDKSSIKFNNLRLFIVVAINAFDNGAAVRKKISDLRKLKKALAKMVSECVGGNLPDCPIVDILSSVPEPNKH